MEHHKRPLPKRSYKTIEDAPMVDDKLLVQSVIDMRKVFSAMSEDEFIEYYRRKYRTGLTVQEISSILRALK